MREIKFVTENHLTEDQFKKLIAEKFERAKLYHLALTKREIESKSFDRWSQRVNRQREPALHVKHGAINVGGLPDGKF